MAFICYEEKLLLIRTFQHDYFKDFKDEMMKEIETNYMDFDSSDGERLDTENFKARQIVYESLSAEITSKLEILIYSTLKTKVKTVHVENEVTITTYEEGDYLTKYKNPIYNSCRDTLCMYMLLSLQEAEEGGEFKLHTGDRNCFLTVSSDVLFDKSILHECSQVKAGKKRIAVFNVIVKLKSEKGVLGTISYMDNDIYLYDNNKDNAFCYCEIEFIQSSSLHAEHFFVGIITNRSGKCMLVHNNFEVNISEYRVFNSLQELTLYIIGNEYITINLKYPGNIFWSNSNNDLFLPKDKELFKILVEVPKKENSKFYKVELVKEECIFHAYCVIGKYYFNLPDSKTIIDYILNNSIDNRNIINWKDLSDLHKRYILSWMPYHELFDLATYTKDDDVSDNSDTEEASSDDEAEYRVN
ncbi:vaccinia C4L/C10L-like protein [Mudlarkpox virus]|nr:vaccinia C4L/C10L-like protein [Mudlarkpox virus]